MTTRGFTYVSIRAHTLEEPARLYESLLGLQTIPVPEFPFLVRSLRVGELPLHLYESGAAAAERHFGLDVAGFVPSTRRRGTRATSPFSTRGPMARRSSTRGT